jgi:hypothetical protein
MRTVQGVFVDPFARVTTMVKVGKDIREIQSLLKVEMLEVFNPSRGHDGPDVELWVDEMGTLRENPGWWFGSWNQLLAGRCFICRPGLKNLQKSHSYDLVAWIRPGMNESIAQIQHLNRARVLSNLHEVSEWEEDRRQSKVMTQMLALAVEPAALLP